ncbi:MAG: hypothetical protein QXU08_08170 [Ignisphaera sp.]
MRSIGDIVAVLMVVSITIAAVTFTALVITSIMRQSEPKGAILSIQGVRAIPLTPNYSILLVEALVSTHGSGSAKFTNSKVLDPSGNTLSCTINSPDISTVFSSGQTFTITMTCSGGSSQWVYRQITVEVTYEDIGSGGIQIARGVGVVLPYS